MFLKLAISAAIIASAFALPTPDSVVPETGFAQAFNPAKAAKQTIQSMLEAGSDDSACGDLAQSMVDEVTNAVSERQAILDALSTGDECPGLLAESVTAAESALAGAQTAKSTADSAAAEATSATVTFSPAALTSLTEGECGFLYESAAYVSAKNNVETTAAAAESADGVVSTTQKALDDARSAQATAIKQCQCNAYHAYDTAWAAATEHAAAETEAYTKGKHMQCVLAGTDPAACDVGTIPTANPITLAPGVTGEDCPEPSVDTDGSLKIEGGGNEGRLMAFHNGEWGTVCDDHFDTNNNGAHVACRQMGYASGTYSANFRGTESDESVVKIVYDDIQCTGTEARLQDCPGLRYHNSDSCSHGEDSGVVCSH